MPTGPIQTNPRGLLSLLALKNLGDNPWGLDGLLQPSIDLRQFYLAQDRSWVQGNLSLTNAAGGPSNFTSPTTPVVVPTDEVWWIWNASGACQGAGTGATAGVRTGEVAVVYNPQEAPNVQVLARSQSWQFASANNYGGEFLDTWGNIVMRLVAPRSNFGWAYTDLRPTAGNNFGLTLNLEITRLKI